jgi:RHS repeat-associated protein
VDSLTYTIDSVDRIASATGMGFTWDDNGNLQMWDDGSDDWAYRYDPEDRLINVKKNSVTSARYTYDAGGRRVRSWGAAGTTDYVYSGFNVVDEIKGGAHEKHVYAGSMHLASISSGTVEYYHVDHLGSTRLKTNSTGGVIYESNYEPYGPEHGESGSEEFRYTGNQEDMTGLYYFGARYYDPVTGRFTTRDSTFGDLSDPQSLNRYTYCRNNPHKYTDPDGKEPISAVIGSAIVIGGTLGSLTRLTLYAFDCVIRNEAPTLKGVAKAGVTGFISGATSSVAAVVTVSPFGPAGGLAVKAAGSSLEYMATQAIEGEEITLEGVITSGGEGLVTAGISNIIGIRYISEGLTSDKHLQTIIKITVINPSVSAAKTAIRQIGEDILTDPKTYEIFKPVDYYQFHHSHDPWVYGR